MAHPGGKVLVLGDGMRAPLTVIRSLGRYGLEVHLAWCDPESPITRSRYLARHHAISEFAPSAPAWRDEFDSLCRRERFDLVIPCTDSAVMLLQLFFRASDLAPSIYLLSDRAFRVTFDKLETLTFVDPLAIRTPPWRPVRSEADLRAAARDYGFPLVLKPISSFALEKSPARRGVTIVFSEDDLATARLNRPEGEPVIAQAFFAGRGVGVEVLAQDGTILVALQHERVHEAPLGGDSSYRRTTAPDPELLAAARAIVAELRYTGVLMVEFKRNAATADWVFIETNGRFWGSLPLAVAAGADFPKYLYQMLVEGRTTFPQAYRLGLYGRNHVLDAVWFRKNWSADRRDPKLCTTPLLQTALELRHLFLLNEANDAFVADDPAPAMVELRELLARRLGRTGTQLYARILALPLYTAWHRRRLRKQLANALSVAFICKGNIYRSPFAAECLRARKLPDLTVRSAGYLPLPGRPTPERAQRAALAYGVQLDAHRSVVVDAELINRSDIVLVFDAETYLWMARRFRRARYKIFLLGVLLDSRRAVIADPYAQDNQALEACYRTIAASVAALGREIESCRGIVARVAVQRA